MCSLLVRYIHILPSSPSFNQGQNEPILNKSLNLFHESLITPNGTYLSYIPLDKLPINTIFQIIPTNSKQLLSIHIAPLISAFATFITCFKLLNYLLVLYQSFDTELTSVTFPYRLTVLFGYFSSNLFNEIRSCTL